MTPRLVGYSLYLPTSGSPVPLQPVATVAQKFLSSRRAIHFAGINISVGIDGYHVRPVELASLAAAASKSAQFRQVLTVDHVDDVIAEIGDVHATLLRVGREIHRARRAANVWGAT